VHELILKVMPWKDVPKAPFHASLPGNGGWRGRAWAGTDRRRLGAGIHLGLPAVATEPGPVLDLFPALSTEHLSPLSRSSGPTPGRAPNYRDAGGGKGSVTKGAASPLDPVKSEIRRDV